MMHIGIPSGKLETGLSLEIRRLMRETMNLLISTPRDSFSKNLTDRGKVVMHIPFMEELLGEGA
jgi:hypothetical protein